MTTVFISHSTKDSVFAREQLRTFLERRGITTWFSDEDIPSAVDWERRIRNGLNDAQWCIVILSPDAVKSDWVQAEVHWALEKRKGRVIPIMLKDCDPADLHLKLLRIQYLDFRRDPDAAATRLLGILESERFTGEVPSAQRERDGENTVLLDEAETVVRLLAIAGPQKGSQFTTRFRQDCIVGRGKDADVRVLDDCVSRMHAEIVVTSRKGEKQLLLTDLGSANGTFVNEYRVKVPTSIREGDVIDFGETRVLLQEVT